ncbi:hypothetical protein B0H11DRAFT_1723739 [Mycena galericulata]|nr:hypothetical protein B0H11DRAFT_1723739 [Mycena galericulata]
MKFALNIITLCCFYIATVWAQGVQIGSPAPGATIQFGSNFTLQLIRPDDIEAAIEVGIAIGLLPCPISEEATCPPPEDQLGDILFTGPFTPTLHPMALFYENFTVTAPSSDSGFSTGRAQLSVVRFFLIGAGPSPTTELVNITVNMSD